MGDRAVVMFKDENETSPAVYLHWHGSDVRKLLELAAPRMRAGNAGYACARFIGVCHEKIDGAWSLGVYSNSGKPEDHDPGDHGVFVVDLTTGKVAHVRDEKHRDWHEHREDKAETWPPLNLFHG
jgi:hypothetical protein